MARVRRETTNNSANGSATPEERMSAFVANQIETALLARSEFLKQFTDPRRDYDDECGYPKGATGQFTAEQYEELYEREPIATRVVQLYPKECWQVTPEVVEDEDSEDKTEFEQAWENLCTDLRGGSWYNDEKGSIVWEYLYRGDLLSGIGSWSIILLGFNDGRMLQDPVEGGVPDGVPRAAEGMQTEATKDVSGVSEVQQRRVQEEVHGDPISTTDPPNMGDVSKDIYGGPVTKDSLGNPLRPLSSTMGTDALYRGVQFTPETPGSGAESRQGMQDGVGGKRELKLLFMRPYAQYLVQVVQYEADIRNPRFGHPIMYLVTVNDPRQQHTGVGLPLATVRVHWSRVIHIADELQSSEVFGVPRMRPVLNRILDLRKLYGGSAEMYWRGAFPGLSLETHPQLGGDVLVNPNIEDMMEQYMNGLQRYLALTGMSAKTLAPQVVDPSGQVEKQIEAICIQLGCPVRVFKGSERGELASSQDDQAWNDRLRYRQNMYITPRIITPFIDRLISYGVLPEPEDGYKVIWPDLEALSKKDKAAIALQTTQALAAYVSGGIENIVPPHDFLSRIIELDEEDVEEILEDAKSAKEDDETMTVPSEQDEEDQKQQQADQLKAMKQAGTPPGIGGGKPPGGVGGAPGGSPGLPLGKPPGGGAGGGINGKPASSSSPNAKQKV